jgi:hypothetical protein
LLLFELRQYWTQISHLFGPLYIYNVPATHFLLCHLSVKGNERKVRREFPVSPTFKPSDGFLHYAEMDVMSRMAIRDHLQHVNGSEDDLANVNWGLASCWKLNDRDGWFSFAIILQCMPVARALSRGTSKYRSCFFYYRAFLRFSL